MKKNKFLTLFLIVCLIITFFVGSFPVDAANTEKISYELANIIAQGDMDTIPVYIFLKQFINEEEIEKTVGENYTWTNEKEHLKYYRAEVKNVVTIYINEFINDNKGVFDKIIYQPQYAEFFIATVKKDNIYLLVDNDKVSNLDYYSDYQPDPDDSLNLFENNFRVWSNEKKDTNLSYVDYEYNELYYHEIDGVKDWILVYARYDMIEPEEMIVLKVGGIGNRIIISQTQKSPFITGYAVYNIEENEYYDLSELKDDYSKYENLKETLEDLNIGLLNGDINNDGFVDILDAVDIQKLCVDKINLNEIPEEVLDINNDNKTDILDAVMLQKYAVT